MFDSQDNAPGDEAQTPGVALARTSGGASFAPRVVTTGRKSESDQNLTLLHCDQETGEGVYAFMLAGREFRTRMLNVPDAEVSPSIAFIDALAFSIVPPADQSFRWLLEQMKRFIDLGPIEQRRGMFGFKQSARFGEGAGVIAWGGESQRGRVYFSLMGKGCGMVTDWHALAGWMERYNAIIKRADVAYDDLDGKLLSIPWAIKQYQEGGFNAGGRKPSHTCMGDWLEGEGSTKGRTLAIGNRASGKYARIYEKGKQLGASSSKWTRFEVEWRAQDRYIPIDILTRPGHYLAGAYPCMAFLSEEQSVIRTITKGAQIAFEKAVENAKQHCGKLVNLMLAVLGGDYAEVVNRLSRPGIPMRIDPFSYHVKRNPMMLDGDIQGAFA